MLRHHLFQPPVFALQLAELLHIADVEAGIFRSPLIKRGIRDAVLAAELVDPDAGLGTLEHRNDLFLRMPLSCHGPLLWGPSQHSRTSTPMV